jgi:hypothetical protein
MESVRGSGWRIRRKISLHPVVQAALPLPAEMAEFAGILDFIEALGGHPITDGDIALAPEGMVGEVMGLEIGSNLAVAPFQNRQKLPAGILPAENLQSLAMI